MQQAKQPIFQDLLQQNINDPISYVFTGGSTHETCFSWNNFHSYANHQSACGEQRNDTSR